MPPPPPSSPSTSTAGASPALLALEDGGRGGRAAPSSTPPTTASDADLTAWAAALAGPPAGVVGSPAWSAQHVALVRLALAAHADALGGGEAGRPVQPLPAVPTTTRNAAGAPPPPHRPDRVPALLASTPGAVLALVRAVVTAAAWREWAWPAVADALTSAARPARPPPAAALAAEAALYHEPAVASLLSLVLLSDVPSALLFGGPGGDDAACDAAEWAGRAVRWLDGEAGGRARAAAVAAAAAPGGGGAAAPAALADPASAAAEAATSAALAALGAVRGLAQRAGGLGPGVADRLGGSRGAGASHHPPVLPALAGLLSRPPWEVVAAAGTSAGSGRRLLRRTAAGWTSVTVPDSADDAPLPPHAGHAWLAALWCVAGPGLAPRTAAWAGGPGGRSVAARLAAAVRAPGPHHAALPPLAGLLLPALDALVAGEGSGPSGGGLAATLAAAARVGGGPGGDPRPPPPSSHAPGLLIAELPSPLASCLASVDWAGTADACVAAMMAGGGACPSEPGAGLLAVADALAADPRLAGGGGGGRGGGGEDSGAACASATVTVRLWRRGSTATPPRTLTLRPVPGAAAEAVSVGGGGGAALPVAGARTRLEVAAEKDAPLPPFFPPSGRLVATVPGAGGGRALEASFDLPAPEGGSAGDLAPLPPSLWLTAGLLVGDGAALQLRLRRVTGRAVKCGGADGGWAAYECVGGALTARVD